MAIEVDFYGPGGVQLKGILTGTDYEEIEVTTPDGEKYYMDNSWLEHKHGERE